jgi:dinuclear metal center YbgI/SA1388 family protein
MKVKDVIKYLDSIAPPQFQESYDNSGLIVGQSSNVVNGVLVCLDCTEEVVQEAIDLKCNLIVAHHPIIFSGLKKINGSNYVERTVIKAIKNDINIFAIHTNLDNVVKGVNGKIANQLGLINRKVLSPKPGLLVKLSVYCPVNAADELRKVIFSAGAGHISDYSNCSFNILGKGTFKPGIDSKPYVGKVGETHQEDEIKIEVILLKNLLDSVLEHVKEHHPYEEVAYDVYSLENKSDIGSGLIGELENEIDAVEFLKTLKVKMNTKMIRHTAICKNKIKKVALCGGSGSFLLDKAINLNADVFITADFKYHEFFDAEKKLIIADIGHFESEQYTIDLISDGLKENFSNFAIRLTAVNTNPINYL